MARHSRSGNNAIVSKRSTFADRGGWWVAAQIPILTFSLLISPWTSRELPGAYQSLQIAGVALIVLGAGTLMAAMLTLGSSLTPFPKPRRRAQLITHGVFRYVRHPIYSGLISASIGWALVWLSVAGLLYSALVLVFFDRKARREEAWLTERFPDYAMYMRRVRRFLPGVY